MWLWKLPLPASRTCLASSPKLDECLKVTSIKSLRAITLETAGNNCRLINKFSKNFRSRIRLMVSRKCVCRWEGTWETRKLLSQSTCAGWEAIILFPLIEDWQKRSLTAVSKQDYKKKSSPILRDLLSFQLNIFYFKNIEFLINYLGILCRVLWTESWSSGIHGRETRLKSSPCDPLGLCAPFSPHLAILLVRYFLLNSI